MPLAQPVIGAAALNFTNRNFIVTRAYSARPSELLAIEEEGGAPIGCLSLVRGWPAADTVHIGLLLVVESRQGQGHGSAAWAALEARARGWPEVRRARIAVLGIDQRAQRFWRQQGFVPTGEALRSWRMVSSC